MTERIPGWLRRNYDIIRSLIPKGSSILDLGCGDGTIFKNLRLDRNIKGMGIEIDEEKVIQAIANGVPVVQADIDKGLGNFKNGSYDFVILNQTLQMVKKPEYVVSEMLRVGRKAIVGFPNFGSIKIRVDLFSKGRMPVNKNLPYEWFDSPNIHLFTIKDFIHFCHEKGYKILDTYYLQSARANFFISAFPNLLATEAVFLIGNSTGETVLKNVKE